MGDLKEMDPPELFNHLCCGVAYLKIGNPCRIDLKTANHTTSINPQRAS